MFFEMEVIIKTICLAILMIFINQLNSTLNNIYATIPFLNIKDIEFDHSLINSISSSPNSYSYIFSQFNNSFTTSPRFTPLQQPIFSFPPPPPFNPLPPPPFNPLPPPPFNPLPPPPPPPTFNQPTIPPPPPTFNQPTIPPPPPTFNQPTIPPPPPTFNQPTIPPPPPTFNQPTIPPPPPTFTHHTIPPPPPTFNQPTIPPPPPTFNQKQNFIKSINPSIYNKISSDIGNLHNYLFRTIHGICTIPFPKFCHGYDENSFNEYDSLGFNNIIDLTKNVAINLNNYKNNPNINYENEFIQSNLQLQNCLFNVNNVT